MNEKEGFIYIYKCIVGSHSDICKIGKTIHFKDDNDRLMQHIRTAYYGFIPYCDFITGRPIATAFKVKNKDEADTLVKNHFKSSQISSIEVYNIDYDDAIKELYTFLNEKEQFIEIIKDGISKYDFLNEEELDTTETTKSNFIAVKDQILTKYNNSLPEELLNLLKDENEFKNYCSSHYRSGNYIKFPDNQVLDLHFNKSKRIEILNKLKSFL